MNYTVLRNGCVYYLPSSAIKEDDLVQATTGEYLPASSYQEFSHLFPNRNFSQGSADVAGGDWLFKLILAAGIGYLFWKAFEPPPQRQRRSARRVPNDEYLPDWKKQIVRERDGEICTYCEAHDPNGHVDHRVSRKNGGTNHLNNLVWACSPCNLSKGAMNAREFRRLISSQVRM